MSQDNKKTKPPRNSITIEPGAQTKKRLARIAEVKDISQRKFLTNLVKREVDEIWASPGFAQEHQQHLGLLGTPGVPDPDSDPDPDPDSALPADFGAES